MDNTAQAIDIVLKVVAAIAVILVPIVGVLWKALNTAWEARHVDQVAYIAKLEEQQAREETEHKEQQAQYRELLVNSVKVIEQNTEAQSTSQQFAKLVGRLERVKGRAPTPSKAT